MLESQGKLEGKLKKISIKELKIKIDNSKILNALKLKQKIEIDIEGNIYINEKIPKTKIKVFEIKNNENIQELVDVDILLKNLFKNYKVLISGNQSTLSLLSAWQEIIFLNQDRMLYFDHQTDGVEFFEDKELEEIAWNVSACDISCREISEFIEANCKGTLVYYDNQIQFNGFVLVDDISEVRIKVADFVKSEIKKKIQNEQLDLEDEDVIESLEFF